MIQDNSEQIIKFIDNIEFSWKKKKLAHAYFRRRIFSKFFGGKIRHVWPDVTYRLNNLKKMARVY